MAIGLTLSKLLIIWTIPGSTQGASYTKKNLVRMQKQKVLGWWERFAPAKGTSILEKYLKIILAFNLLDLHYLLAIVRGTPKSWWPRSKRSSSRVGRMIALKLCSPMIAPNFSRMGHNSTPLNWKTCRVRIQNLVVASRRGSFTLIWWKREIQESPRGMKAYLKLRLSLLIHAKTSKRVNSTIKGLTECFLGLKHILWRIGSLLQLFYSKRSRLGFFLFDGMCMHGQCLRMHKCAYVCMFIRVSDSLSYLECDFLTKASLMTPMA